MQAAYLAAFANMGSFEGRSSLSTWLTRIVVNEALMRRRSEQRRRTHLEQEGVTVLDDYRETMMRGSHAETPDVAVAREQIRKLLEKAVAELPDSFRTVFVLREIEGLSGDLPLRGKRLCRADGSRSYGLGSVATAPRSSHRHAFENPRRARDGAHAPRL